MNYDEIQRRARELFRIEAAELIVELEAALLALEQAPTDEAAIARVFRAMHTLKGSGASIGFNDLAAFLHDVEDVYNAARAGRVTITSELVDATLRIVDAVSAYLAASSGDAAGKLTAAAGALAQLTAAMTANPVGDRAPATTARVASPPCAVAMPRRGWTVGFRPHVDLFLRGSEPGMFLDDLRALGDCEITLLTDCVPPFAELNPEQCHLAWRIAVATAADEATVRDVFAFVADDCDLEISPLPATDPETTADPADSTAAPAPAPAAVDASTARHHDVLRVSSEKLDRLVNLVGELVILRSQVSAACGQLGRVPPVLRDAAEGLERLSSEMRDLVLNVRMMPVGEMFAKFKRLARDVARDLGKEVDLAISGESTEMDKSMLDQLNDPLVHLVRNCLDHGLEAPDARVAAGKARRGTLRLSAEQCGDRVLIRVADDGRGLDAEAIRIKAIAHGLIAADANPTTAELQQLIFQPGFSTAAKVSQVSGRGVGMDVVKKRIEQLRGTIELRSEPGKGTEVLLSLPLTLAIIDGLMVGVDQERFILPLSLVREIIELPRGAARSGERNVVPLRGQLIPYLRLRDVLEVDGEAPSVERVAVVDLDGKPLGIAVDQVLGSHQTVLKSLGWVGQRIKVFSGATIIGNGRVALILDVPALVAHAAAEHGPSVGLER